MDFSAEPGASLLVCYIPVDWLQANITAIFKKGSKTNPAIYRPAYLTYVTCKLLEHIIFSNIMNHADKLDILKHYQHGFRKGHSCESQLLITVEDIGRQLDQQHQIDILILDFAKDFDMVPHRRLLTKLKCYRVRGRMLNWIQSWLVQSHKTVIVDGRNSMHVQVKSGIPQGTVLGALLFLI